MKVHRIITTIEVENDNSITSVEVTKLSLDDIRHPLVITNLTTNGSANDIKQVYDSIDKCRLAIAIKLKSIVSYISNSKRNISISRMKINKFNRSNRIIILNFNSSNNTMYFHNV